MIPMLRDPDLSPAQASAVHAEGNVFVAAGPGTGKTHVIVARLRRLVSEGADPRKLLVVTFSRRAAAELRERIASDAGVDCDVRTFHGFASRILEADGPRFAGRRLLDALTEALLVETALARYPFETLPAAAVASERFHDEFARFVADVRRAGRASAARLRDAGRPRLADLLGAFDELTALHDALRASDVDDLTARAVDALADPESAASRWLAGRYDHVLIDEFQDVDATQLALVARLDATLFAVGDEAQAIYGFRGALPRAIDDAIARFVMRRIVLDESRRCPQVVCDLASRTPLLGAAPLRSRRDVPGSVTVRAARTTLDEAALIADRVEDALTGGTAPERIAILLRAMRPLGPAIDAELRARGVPVAGGGPSAFLADPDVETLRLALRLLADPADAVRWAAFLGAAGIVDGIRASAALRGRSLATIDDGVAVLAAADAVDRTRLDGLASTLRAAAEAFDADDAGRAARRIVNGLGLAARAMRNASGTARARAGVGRLGRVIDALSAAQRHLRGVGQAAGSADVLDSFERRIDAVAAEEVPDDGVPGVRLLTVHGAKGLEFDLVVIGDAVDGRFPSAARRSTLLDDDAIAAARFAGVELRLADDDAALREEASLWYVAVTRSRDAVVITFAAQGADGAPQRPSRFVPASLHPDEHAMPFERPLDRIEDAARASGDPGAVAALRATLADSPIRASLLDEGPDAFAPLPDRPVVYRRPPSVSAAEQWLACPRRFYYRDVLRLRDDPGIVAEAGNALHAVLARFHDFERDFTAAPQPDRVAAWKGRLRTLREAEWARRAFEPAAKRDAYARFADRVLDAYADSLADDAAQRPFTVVACERPIESAYGTGRLRGTLDRADRAVDGGLILRDYKSGHLNHAFAKTLAKAVESGEPVPGAVPDGFRPQLAMYRRGAEEALDLAVTRLEYVYLKGKKGDDFTGIASDAVDVDDAAEERMTAVDAVLARDFVDAYATGVAGPVATAADVKTCRYCAYVAVCPGPAPC